MHPTPPVLTPPTDADGIRLVLRALLGLAVLLACSWVSGPAEAAYTPAYWYRAEALVLFVYLSEAEMVQVVAEPVGPDGRVRGLRLERKVKLERGSHRIELPVGSTDGHRVELHIGARLHRLWCQRGTWAAGPEGLELTRTRRGVRLPHVFVRRDDIQLVRGFAVSVRANPERREVVLERTFGKGRSQGVRPSKQDVLIVVAKGTVGPVRVTLVERVGARLRYFDGALVLDPRFRRFELPLSTFEAREPNTRLGSLHSIAIETVLPPVAGSTVTVAFLGLGRPTLRIAGMKRTPKGVTTVIASGPLAARSQVSWFGPSGGEVESLALSGRAPTPLPDDAAEKIWLRAELASGVEVTDPPDAPHTYYLRPPEAGDALLVDDFDAAASVNAQRGLLTRFASSEVVRRRAGLERLDGALRLFDTPESTDEYSGLHSHLLHVPGAAHHSVELVVSGAGPTAGLVLELTDVKHQAARISLAPYLRSFSSTRQAVRLPLVAFEAAHRAFHPGKVRGRLHRLSVVMRGAPPLRVPRSIELDRIRFVPERSAICVASFTRSDLELDDLGHSQRAFAEGGQAKIRSDFGAAGKEGAGLRVEASGLGGAGYAIVHFGLGGLDVRGHRSVEFFARAPEGAAEIDVVISDGKKAHETRLSRLGQVSKEWARFSLPLAEVAGLRLDRLERLQFVFRGADGPAASLELDEIWIVP